MKTYVITIDTGTTNTRVLLWDENREIAAKADADTGVRNTAIDGNNDRLKKAVRGCIEEVMKQAEITFQSVSRVIGCGMITSNVGLVEIPHVTAPAGEEELARHAEEILLKDVCPMHVTFIPGIKNSDEAVTLDNYEKMDIMRGEEVEAIAILNRYPAGKSYLLILPGSHSKFISVDENKRITGCLTSITGELLSSITNDTIIADAVGRQFVSGEDYDREMVLTGFTCAGKTGMGRACFSARILNQFAIRDQKKIANYILGVALQNDITAVRNSDALCLSRDTTIVVSGKNPLRRALADVIRADGYFRMVEEYIPDDSMPLSPAGALIVADLIGSGKTRSGKTGSRKTRSGGKG